MAVDIFRKRSTESVAPVMLEELVTVGGHIDDSEKLTFSGGDQGNAVIVPDPPTLILIASKAEERRFRTTFQVETPGRELSAEGALRLDTGDNHKQVGVQILRDSPTEVTVVFYTDLKDKEKDLGSFALGIAPLFSNDEAAPLTVWHDPTILWEPPRG